MAQKIDYTTSKGARVTVTHDGEGRMYARAEVGEKIFETNLPDFTSEAFGAVGIKIGPAKAICPDEHKAALRAMIKEAKEISTERAKAANKVDLSGRLQAKMEGRYSDY